MRLVQGKATWSGNVDGGTFSSLVGGLVGQNYATVSDSFATGTVSGTGADHVGGVIADNSGSASATNNWWLDQIGDDATQCRGNGSSASETGVCEAEAGGLSAFYNTGTHAVYLRGGDEWDFTTVWQSHAGALPTLQ